MEVLTAYVRQHSPRRPEEEAQQVEEDAAVEKKSEEDSSGESETAEVPAPAADIQAIMTVIRRRTRSFGHGEPEPLDLNEANLSGANLWKANLSEAILPEAILSGADISGADISGVEHLTQEQLEKTMSLYENTRLPPDLKPPGHWDIKNDEQIEGD
jgi:hypothetical protein